MSRLPQANHPHDDDKPWINFNGNAFASRRSRLTILAIFSFICSRSLFAFFDDPEGPNLLIVTVMAAMLFISSFLAHSYFSSASSLKRLSLAMLTQVALACVLYLILS